jgi:hypothetical protein
MHFLWVIVIGFIAGIVARLLAPGPNNPAGFIPRRCSALPALSSPPSSVRRSAGTGPIRARASSAPLSARSSSCSSGTDWSRRALSQTPAPDAGFRLDRHPARRLAFDDDRARDPAAARNGQQAVGPPRFQNGPPRLFRCDGHQCDDDLDLAFKILGETLRSQNRIVECRRIAPYPAQAVLRFPYLAHVTP